MKNVSVWIIPETLSDGSVVRNVKVGTLLFPAVTEEDAYEFAEKICGAINDHTTFTSDLFA